MTDPRVEAAAIALWDERLAIGSDPFRPEYVRMARAALAAADEAKPRHKCCVTCGAIIPEGFVAMHNHWHDEH